MHVVLYATEGMLLVFFFFSYVQERANHREYRDQFKYTDKHTLKVYE